MRVLPESTTLRISYKTTIIPVHLSCQYTVKKCSLLPPLKSLFIIIMDSQILVLSSELPLFILMVKLY